MPAQCWNRNMAPMERERDALRSVGLPLGLGLGMRLVSVYWILACFTGNCDCMRFGGDGLAAWRQRRVDSPQELHGHVFIFDLCGFIFVHTILEWAAPTRNRDQAIGHQALAAVFEDLLASPPTRRNGIKQFRGVLQGVRVFCLIEKAKFSLFFMLIFAIPFICIHNAQWSQVAQKSYRISNTTYPNEILNSFDFSPT